MQQQNLEKEQERDRHIDEFLQMFPDLPNPDHYPKVFSYFVSLYWHNKTRKS